MGHPRTLDRDTSVLVVVDVQEGFRGRMLEHDRVVASAVRRLLEAAKLMQVPVIATVQYPRGLGPTQPEVAEGFPPDFQPIEKLSMSCYGEPAFRERLAALDRNQVVLCGVEAHACVNQTAHDLMAEGYSVHVVHDAISSRSALDLQVSWEKMIGSGVVPATVEMVLLEWVRTAAAPEFKAIQRLIK